MLLRSLALLASAAMVAAENTTITSMFFLDATDPITVGVKDLGSESGKTSYTLYCRDDVPKTECPMILADGMGFTYINDYYHSGATLLMDHANYTQSVGCSIEIDTGRHTSTDATCSVTMLGPDGKPDPRGGSRTTSYHDVTYLPVTVTAGSVTASETGSESSAATSASESESGSGSEPAGTEPTPSPTGSAERVMGARALMLGGVLVAMGVVL